MNDFKALGKNEQGALIAGAVAFILSLFSSYVTVSAGGGGVSFSSGTNAWTSYATLGMLLVLAATAVVAVKAFAAQVLPDTVPWSLVAAAAAGLGTVLLILRALTVGGGGAGVVDVSVGPGWSGWLLFIATIVLTAFTVLMFRTSGETMPDFKKSDPPAA